MTNMQTCLPLVIVWAYILNLFMLFLTQPSTSEMKCKVIYNCSFHFISSNSDATQASTSMFIKWWTMIFHWCSQLCYLWSLLIAWSSFTIPHQAIWPYDSTIGFIFLESYVLLHVTIWSYWFVDHNFASSSPLPWSVSAKCWTNFSAMCSMSLQSLRLALQSCI